MGTKIGRILYTHAEPNNIKDPNAVSVEGAKKNVLATQQWKGHSQRETSKESWCRIGKGKEDEDYILRIDGDTEQLCRSTGDTVSEGITN